MRKTVLITGASSGIGKSAAIYFHEKGWNVAATMRRPEKEKELSNLSSVKCLELDVQDESSIAKAIDDTISLFGTIHVIVNNAGYGAVGPFEAASKDQIQRQFDTNVFGLMNVTRNILPYFRERKQGVIINIASVGGRITFPLYSLYHSTKWAVEGFSESLHYELKPHNIKVKIVEPGAIKTDFYERSMDIVSREGMHAYDAYVHKTFLNIQEIGMGAVGPRIVARKIYRAAISRSWKMRYPVGSGAPFLLIMRRFIPDSWFFSLVRMVIERKRK